VKRFAILAEPLDPAAVEAFVRNRANGGVVTFAGIVRDRSNEGRPVNGLSYEAHAEMAEREFERIALEAHERFGPCEAAVHHRIGQLEIGETAVVVSVASAHRDVAFEACRYVIDQLKKRAPIWKEEHSADGGARWKANDDGTDPR
jgi:molybdopterin synthase catalytic subunit